VSAFRAYIRPFVSLGVYGEEIEVTDEIITQSVSAINQKIDQSEYEVGFFTFGSFAISFRNEKGKFLDAVEPSSIFQVKRDQSIFILRWTPGVRPPICGFATCGIATLGGEVEIFRGIIEDKATSLNFKNKTITFTILDIFGALSRVPYDFATPLSSPTTRPIFEKAIQPLIDLGLITEIDESFYAEIFTTLVIDEAVQFENKNCKEVLDIMLRTMNSVLLVKDQKAFVKVKNTERDLTYEFIGSSSFDGLENIISIDGVDSGIRQLYNYWLWVEFGVEAKAIDSIATYGEILNEPQLVSGTGASIDYQDILDRFLDFFGVPKTLVNITVPIDCDSLNPSILDWTIVDVPPTYFTDTELSFYDLSSYDSAQYAEVENQFNISKDKRFRIMGRIVNIKNSTITFQLREV
jgi:hypothetical protein